MTITITVLLAMAQVLFAVETDLEGGEAGGAVALLPLGCFDPGRGAVVGGADCLKLVPARAEVETAHGKARVRGRGNVTCALDGEGQPGLRVAGDAPSGLAGWPRLALRVPARRDAGPAELAAVRAALHASGLTKMPGEHVSALVWRAALDARGEARLIAADVGRGPDGEGARLGALLLLRDGAPAVLLAHEAGAAFHLLGLTDLDGDGHPELVLERGYYEGGRTTLERLTGDKLERIGGGTYCGS